MNYRELSEEQKIQYKEYCEELYGKTYTYSEIGEPLYFNEKGDMIDLRFLMNILFSN